VEEGFRPVVKDGVEKAQASAASTATSASYTIKIKTSGEYAAAKETLAELKNGALRGNYVNDKTSNDSIPYRQLEIDINRYQNIVDAYDARGVTAKNRQAVAILDSYKQAFQSNTAIQTKNGPVKMSTAMIYQFAKDNGIEGELGDKFTKDYLASVSPLFVEPYAEWTKAWAGTKMSRGYDAKSWNDLKTAVDQAVLNGSRDGSFKDVAHFKEFLNDQFTSMVSLRIGQANAVAWAGRISTATLQEGLSVVNSKGIADFVSKAENGKLDLVVTDEQSGSKSYVSPAAKVVSETVAEVLSSAATYAIGSNPTATTGYERRPRFHSYYEPTKDGRDVTSKIIIVDESTKTKYTWRPSDKKGQIQLYQQGKDGGWNPVEGKTLTDEQVRSDKRLQELNERALFEGWTN